MPFIKWLTFSVADAVTTFICAYIQLKHLKELAAPITSNKYRC